MSGRTRLRFGFDVALLFLFAYAAYEAASFSELARYMPLYVAVAGVLLSLLNLGLDVLRFRRSAGTGGGFAWSSPEEYVAEDVPDETELFQRQLYYLAWILAYLGLIALMGIVAATTVFTVAFLRREAGLRWRWVAVSVALVLLALVGFSELLNLRWPASLASFVLSAR